MAQSIATSLEKLNSALEGDKTSLSEMKVSVPDSTKHSDVPELIKEVKSYKSADLIGGTDFANKLKSVCAEPTKIIFTNKRPDTSYYTDKVDFSVKGDKSILGWKSGTTVYISSPYVIQATNCEGMFHLGTYTSLNKTLKEINFDNFAIGGTSMKYMFTCNTVLSTITGMDTWDTSKIKNMYGTFELCGIDTLSAATISNWDVSSVTTMEKMFANYTDEGQYCEIGSLDLSQWDTSNLTNTSSMFQWCNKLVRVDISGWGSNKITNCKWMFTKCSELEYVHNEKDWSKFNISESNYMFGDCTKLKGYVEGSENKSIAKSVDDGGVFTPVKSKVKIKLAISDPDVGWMTSSRYYRISVSFNGSETGHTELNPYFPFKCCFGNGTYNFFYDSRMPVPWEATYSITVTNNTDEYIVADMNTEMYM